ncbi:glycosyltransferase [Flavobacteriaceae bacterium]|nr:glycosyltransferase [Flavobacteriaceae bacterium]
MSNSKNIIVAPLNWGLGHATRCIPIINELQKNGFTPIIASDGIALSLLIKEFPTLRHIKLPSYNIMYTKNGFYLKLKLLSNIPKLIKAVRKERSIINNLVDQEKIYGIISDNRFGVYHKNITSIYITHQIKVFSGVTTTITSKIHQNIIKKFNECWIPDIKHKLNYSGELSNTSNTKINFKFIGVLSRFKKNNTPNLYDYLVILSGPEPQRTILEDKLFLELKHSTKKIAFIKGVIEQEQIITKKNNIICYNFMTSKELELIINQSNLIIARSGYTTIMDLVTMNKKAFFIPTPGQHEQSYLAKRLKKSGYFNYCKQEDFKEEMLEVFNEFKPLYIKDKFSIDFNELFNCFQGKRKL